MVFRQPFILNTQFDNFTIRIFTLHVGDVAEKKTVPFSYTRISVILLVCHVILLQFTNPPLYARAPNERKHARSHTCCTDCEYFFVMQPTFLEGVNY